MSRQNKRLRLALGITLLKLNSTMLTLDASHPKDPDPKNWRTINGSKVHLTKGKIDGGAGGKFSGKKWSGKQHHQFVPAPNKIYSPTPGKQFSKTAQGHLDKLDQILKQLVKGKGKPSYYQEKIDKEEKALSALEKINQLYEQKTTNNTMSEPKKLQSFYDYAKRYKIEKRPITKRTMPEDPDESYWSMMEDKIIDDIGGRDRTKGSCSSVALAFLANTAGYEVYDFRGGKSLDMFAQDIRLLQLPNLTGVTGYATTLAGEKIDATINRLKELEVGQHYYFACARHAAVIKREGNRVYYLELQGSWDQNGWHYMGSLGDPNGIRASLERRFKIEKGKNSKNTVALVNGAELTNNVEFIDLMGYINNDKDKQKKGPGGGIK